MRRGSGSPRTAPARRGRSRKGGGDRLSRAGPRSAPLGRFAERCQGPARSPGVQVPGARCPGAQVCGCPGAQVCGCPGVRVCGCPGVWVCGDGPAGRALGGGAGRGGWTGPSVAGRGPRPSVCAASGPAAVAFARVARRAAAVRSRARCRVSAAPGVCFRCRPLLPRLCQFRRLVTLQALGLVAFVGLNELQPRGGLGAVGVFHGLGRRPVVTRPQLCGVGFEAGRPWLSVVGVCRVGVVVCPGAWSRGVSVRGWGLVAGQGVGVGGGS